MTSLLRSFGVLGNLNLRFAPHASISRYSAAKRAGCTFSYVVAFGSMPRAGLERRAYILRARHDRLLFLNGPHHYFAPVPAGFHQLMRSLQKSAPQKQRRPSLRTHGKAGGPRSAPETFSELMPNSRNARPVKSETARSANLNENWNLN